MRGLRESIAAVFCIMLFTASYLGAAAKVKHDQYKELDQNVLKSQPEEYRNKKVCYTSVYDKYMTTFPNYATLNGFKPGKFYWLLIAPKNLPVVAKKTKEMNDLILLLKQGYKVKVYGKIKKFRIPPKMTMLPQYYLELADIVIVEETKNVNPADNNNADSTQKPRGPLPPRLRRLIHKR